MLIRWKKYFLQDYSYLNTSTFQLDVFIDCCGTPDQSLLPKIWNTNKESLLAMMDAVHKGITGNFLKCRVFIFSIFKIRLLDMDICWFSVYK